VLTTALSDPKHSDNRLPARRALNLCCFIKR
jgi:hypothetical protein